MIGWVDILGIVLNIIGIVIGIIGLCIGGKVINSIVNINNGIIINQSATNVAVGNTTKDKDLADLVNNYKF